MKVKGGGCNRSDFLCPVCSRVATTGYSDRGHPWEIGRFARRMALLTVAAAPLERHCTAWGSPTSGEILAQTLPGRVSATPAWSIVLTASRMPARI